jgi:hypothetical protein
MLRLRQASPEEREKYFKQVRPTQHWFVDTLFFCRIIELTMLS